MIFFSFSACLLVSIGYLLSVECLAELWMIMWHGRRWLVLAQFMLVSLGLFVATILAISFAWYPRRRWKMPAICVLNTLAGLSSFVMAWILTVPKYGIQVDRDILLLYWLTCFTCLVSSCLFAGHFMRLDVSMFGIKITSEHSTTSDHFLPSSAGITHCQLQLKMMGAMASLYVTTVV